MVAPQVWQKDRKQEQFLLRIPSDTVLDLKNSRVDSTIDLARMRVGSTTTRLREITMSFWVSQNIIMISKVQIRAGWFMMTYSFLFFFSTPEKKHQHATPWRFDVLKLRATSIQFPLENRLYHVAMTPPV